MGIRISTEVKDPDDTMTVTINWAPYLPTGVTIDSYTTVNDPSDLTVNGHTNDTTTTSVNVAGGVLGRAYTVTHRATWSDSQVRDLETVIAVV